MAVDINDPRYSLINRGQAAAGSFAEFLTREAQAADAEAQRKRNTLSQYLMMNPVPNATIYDIPPVQDVPQYAQVAKPTTAIIPAEQVAAGQTAFQSSLPLQPAQVNAQAGKVQQKEQKTLRQNLVKSAPLTVAPNESTNFWKQMEGPVFTYNSVSGIPEYSLGGQLLLARQLGMTPQQMLAGFDAIQAHGITESPYWQEQYNTALQQTGDPNAALAHANLAATEAADNVAGVFSRSLATPTDQASQVATDRAYGRTVLNPSAGEAYKNVLATGSMPVGATAEGNVLARTPDGKVAALPVGPYSAANASYVNAGAQAFQNALMREMAWTPGVGNKGTDPYLQELRRQQLELRVEAEKQRIEAAAKKDPRLAEAQKLLNALPKDDPRRENIQMFLLEHATDAGIVQPKSDVPPAR